ncbi:Metallo-dependent phosphatase-like protein [Entophlyctis helioformis]|nr:Metallo-dependent phosphatase-like protein [Entophlyctis helioformis]
MHAVVGIPSSAARSVCPARCPRRLAFITPPPRTQAADFIRNHWPLGCTSCLWLAAHPASLPSCLAALLLSCRRPFSPTLTHPIQHPRSSIQQNDYLETHIAIIADPQLTDSYSYSQSPGVLLSLTEFYSDIYMRRNFRMIQDIMRPSHIVFAGDIMDGGREWTDDQFADELERLHNVFQLRWPTYMTFGVPGNHDIGFGDTVINHAYLRFRTAFGQLNTAYAIANHTIVTLDTVSLSATRDTPARLEALKFMAEFETPVALRDSKIILVSHVPLFRPENSDCGPRRRSHPITNRRGYQYQNMVQPELTKRILAKFKPDLIISGDDHDDCVYVHNHNDYQTVEHTISTFSWLQGNPYPAYGILTLRPESATPRSPTAPSFELRICSLPPQLYLYFWYIALLVVALVWSAKNAVSQLRRGDSGKGSSRFGSLLPRHGENGYFQEGKSPPSSPSRMPSALDRAAAEEAYMEAAADSRYADASVGSAYDSSTLRSEAEALVQKIVDRASKHVATVAAPLSRLASLCCCIRFSPSRSSALEQASTSTRPSRPLPRGILILCDTRFYSQWMRNIVTLLLPNIVLYVILLCIEFKPEWEFE